MNNGQYTSIEGCDDGQIPTRLYGAINHPLSRHVQVEYQDQDGCSRNGSRELLLAIGIARRGKDIDTPVFSRGFRLDHRGVLFYLHVKDPINQKFEEVVLKMKNCHYQVDSKISRTLHGALLSQFSSNPILDPIMDTFNEKRRGISRAPVKYEDCFELLDGEVIGSHTLLDRVRWTKDTLELLKELPHFRTLTISSPFHSSLFNIEEEDEENGDSHFPSNVCCLQIVYPYEINSFLFILSMPKIRSLFLSNIPGATDLSFSF